MIVAAHQPAFLPWLGWWDKLVRANRLVPLDDVQFPKKGGTWMNRVRIPRRREAGMGDRAGRPHLPRDSQRAGTADPRRQAVAEEARGDARDELPPRPALRRPLPGRAGRDPQPPGGIAEFNESGIRLLAARLELDSEKLVRQSELGVEGDATDILVNLCRALGATAYLTGDGSGGYVEPGKFAAAGLDLVEHASQPTTPTTHVPAATSANDATWVTLP